MANTADELNPEVIRKRIPTLTVSEKILWMGHPTARSMYGRYILGGMILGLYLFFWWANISERPQGEGQLAFLMKTLHLGADLSGVFGLMLATLILAKIVHFSNGPTSGRWTITWVVFAAVSPGIIAFSLYTIAQKKLGASLTGFTLYIFTIYGAIYGFFLFEEKLENYHLIGTVLVFIGVYLAKKKNVQKI